MNPDTQKQIDALTTRLNLLEKSSDIPRNVETAFRERLGLANASTTILSGKVTTNGSGSADILDTRILATSVIVVTPTSMGATTTAEYLAICIAGQGEIRSQGSEYQSVDFNYIIIL